MRIKSLAAGAATITLLSASLALAQTQTTPSKSCAQPPCPSPGPSMSKPDPSTEPANADPMATTGDTVSPRRATTTTPQGQPSTQYNASMPASRLPSGSDPSSPTAPSPMPGSR